MHTALEALTPQSATHKNTMAPTVAIVANSSWNIYNFRQPFIRACKQAGYRVLVIAPVDEYIRYLNEHYFTAHIPLKHLSAQGKNPLRDLLLLIELFRIYRREQPTLVFHFTAKPNIYGSMAARLAGVPNYPTVTGLGYAFLHSPLLRWLSKLLYRAALRKAKKVIFHNMEDEALFLESGIARAGQTAVVNGSGLNTNHFRPLPQPRQQRFIFLFVGRLLYDKGIREYLKAARQLKRLFPKSECWIVGQLDAANPAAVSREELLREVELQNVRYFGSTTDVRPYLKQCDVFVLPSYREGMPRAVLEALAMGKPIITTDTAGCKDAIGPSCGWLVPVQDSIALAKQMAAAGRLPQQELARMGAAARQRALTCFDEKQIVESYFELAQLAQAPASKAARHG